MKNWIKPGKVITMIAPYDVKSGEGLLVGACFAVATYDALSTKEVEAVRFGQVALKKAAGASTGGAANAIAYWNNSTKVVTAVVGSNKAIGFFAKACIDADLVAEVVLVPTLA